MPKQKIAFILSLTIALFHFAEIRGEDKKPQSLYVPVYQVVDGRFPAISEKEIQKIFAEAKILLNDKLGVDGKFEYKGQITREQYSENFYYPYKPPMFSEGKKDGEKIWKWKIIKEEPKEGKKKAMTGAIKKGDLGNAFVDVWGLFGEQSFTFESYKDVIVNNIKMKWQVDELSQFLDDNETGGSSFFEKVAESLFKKYNASVQNIRTCRVNEESILSHSWSEHIFESASMWYQRRRMETNSGPTPENPTLLSTDAFIFYNGPVFEDEIGIPHTMLTGIVNGTTAFVSTFPTYINPSCFQDKIGKVEDDLKAKAAAAVFVHEIGHTFFNLPDYFAIEKEGCMMYVGPKAINLVSRYELVKNTPPCPYEIAAERKAMEK